MYYSERFKRYSRSDSKDSRSKLGSKDSRHASIPSKPGTMDSSNTAYTLKEVAPHARKVENPTANSETVI